MSSVGKPQAKLTEDQIASSTTGKLHISSATHGSLWNESSTLKRDWLSTRESSSEGKGLLRVMTWNMLAQCLVRRDLFPTSDCLKASQREGMLVNEILRYDSDIICLQEVDRLDKLLPPLHHASYAELYAAGKGKLHGCMIVYRDSLFQEVSHVVIEYDELDVREVGDDRQRKGSSRRTKNIGLIVGLRQRGQPNHGYVVATTHLFWHPSFTYERIRQAALLMRETRNFQEAHGLQDWPCLVAGDFNFTPTDPAYRLMVGYSPTTQQLNDIEVSRVVHSSIDPSITQTPRVPGDDEGDATQQDPDRVITNARAAMFEDGLLSDDEFYLFFNAYGPVRSVYEECLRTASTGHDNVIGARLDTMAPGQIGFYEPMWTSYTHYWKTTLDYIFILNRPGPQSRVLSILKTPGTSSLGDGLPLRRVSASDHISLAAEIESIGQCDTN